MPANDGLVCSFLGRRFRSTKSGWSTIDGCTCFDNQGCQQGGETSIRSIQHSRSVEGKNPTLAFRCCVNGCGELGYRKSAKVFFAKIYFQAIHESFHPQKKPAIRYLLNKKDSQLFSPGMGQMMCSTHNPSRTLATVAVAYSQIAGFHIQQNMYCKLQSSF